MKDTKEIITTVLVSLAFMAYLYSVYQACVYTLSKKKDPTQMPPFLSNMITTIGTVLATNFGATIGYPRTHAASYLAFAFFTAPTPKNFQYTACGLYVIVLITAFIVWAIKSFTSDPKQVVSSIPELTKTLLGVMVGALSVILLKSDG